MFKSGNTRALLANAARSVLESLEERRMLSADCLADPEALAIQDELVAIYAEPEDSTIAEDGSESPDDVCIGKPEFDETEEGDPGELIYTLFSIDGSEVDDVVDDGGSTDEEVIDDEITDEEILYKGADGEALEPEILTLETTDESGDGEETPLPVGDIEDNPDVIFYTTGGAVPVSVTLDSGVLTITGSEGNDKVCLFVKKNDPGKLAVDANGVRRYFNKADVTSVVADLGAGNDRFRVISSRGLVSIPMNVKGGAGSDAIRGGAGDDQLEGGAGADRLRGGKGDDTVLGGAGRDMLKGGGGDDVLNGGGSDDNMTGGDGADVNEDAGSRMLDRQKQDKGHRSARRHSFSILSINPGIDVGEQGPGDTGDEAGGRLMRPIWWNDGDPGELPSDTPGSDTGDSKAPSDVSDAEELPAEDDGEVIDAVIMY